MALAAYSITWRLSGGQNIASDNLGSVFRVNSIISKCIQ